MAGRIRQADVEELKQRVNIADVIGDYVTEINVTSPTCVREIDDQFGTSISDDLFAVLEQGRA